MALSFATGSQQWLILDSAGNPVPPSGLIGGQRYKIILWVRNPDSVAVSNVTVRPWHSSFGIGVPAGGGDFDEIQTVSIMPGVSADSCSYASVEFFFDAPTAYGHGCLAAQLVVGGVDVPGEVTSQNADIKFACQADVSTYGFRVCNQEDHPVDMVLSVSEFNTDWILIPKVKSWKPKLVIPVPAGSGNPVPTGPDILIPNPFQVTAHLAAGGVYWVKLQLTLPQSASGKRVYRIQGTVNGQDMGAADVYVEATAVPVSDCYVSIAGGYNSPDIDLFGPDVNNPGQPGHVPHDGTRLKPNSDYKITATVKNDSDNPAPSTFVSFWWTDGGVGWNLQWLSTVSCDIAANQEIEVESPVSFHSAPVGAHRCVIVTLFNVNSPNCNGTDPTAEMSPTSGHNSAAWRNTDSQSVVVGGRFHLPLLVAFPDIFPYPGPEEVGVVITARGIRIPKGWTAGKDLKEIPGFNRISRMKNYPAWALPDVIERLSSEDIQIKVSAPKSKGLKLGSVKMVRGLPSCEIKVPFESGKAKFELTGKLPDSAGVGDIVVVEVTAKYPAMGHLKAMTVKHMEFIHVIKG